MVSEAGHEFSVRQQNQLLLSKLWLSFACVSELFDDIQLELRPITERDLKEVLEVYQQCEDFLALGLEPKASMAMVLQDIETSRQEKGTYCGVYTSDGRLVGVVDFVFSDSDGTSHFAFISLLMIVASLRNQGIGTRILGIVESKIRVAGLASAILTAVQVNNPAALRFWQMHGYRIIGNPEARPDQTVVTYLRKELPTTD